MPYPTIKQHNSKEKPMRDKKILIVEDEGVSALALQVALNKGGYVTVGIAYTGNEAVRMTQEFKPDAILMDIRIKGNMDGIQTTMKICETSDIPVIYLTAFFDDETVRRALTTSAHTILIKPYNPRELYLTIEFALSTHWMEKRWKAEAAMREIQEHNLMYIREAAMRLKNPIEIVEQNISTIILDSESGDYSLEEIIPQLRLQVKNMEQIQQNILDLHKTIIEGFKDMSPALKEFLTK
jgi:CheY-like chemotaxis protein